jgi:hypothetical protein
MYNILLLSHSWLRWVVLILAVWAIYRNYEGFSTGRKWTATDKKFNTFFIGSMHLQLVIGLILYSGVSPMMQGILADMGGSMKNRELRFWGVEHITLMIIAVIVAQIGSIKAKKQPSDAGKFRTAFFWFLAAIILVLIMIPFGIWNPDRPLFRTSL